MHSQAQIMANIRARHKILDRRFEARHRQEHARYVAGLAMIDRSGLKLSSEGFTPDEAERNGRQENWRDWLTRYSAGLGKILRGEDKW